MLTEEQLQERKSYVTGSDASSILGVNPYQSIVDCWQLKLGLVQPPDLSSNPSVRAGNYLEPAVCKMFEDIARKSVITDMPLHVHKEHKWMAGNLDGWIADERAVFEAKTARFSDGWGEQGEAIIPKHYLCQVAHYMAVTDAQYAYVAVLIGGVDFRYYLIDRSPKLEEILIEREQTFWDKNVLGLTPPDPTTYEDVVNLYRGKVLTNPVKAHQGIIMAVDRLKDARQSIAKYIDKEKEIKNEIALYMRDHVELINSEEVVLATFKYNKDGTRFNAKQFEKEHPDLYAQYQVPSPGVRQLKLKGKKDEQINDRTDVRTTESVVTSS